MGRILAYCQLSFDPILAKSQLTSKPKNSAKISEKISGNFLPLLFWKFLINKELSRADFLCPTTPLALATFIKQSWVSDWGHSTITFRTSRQQSNLGKSEGNKFSIENSRNWRLCWSQENNAREARVFKIISKKNKTTKVQLRSTRSRYDLGAWFQSCQAQKVAWRKCPPNWPRAKKPSTRLLTGLRSNPRALSSFNFLSLTKLESRPETPARTCHELFELWVLCKRKISPVQTPRRL